MLHRLPPFRLRFRLSTGFALIVLLALLFHWIGENNRLVQSRDAYYWRLGCMEYGFFTAQLLPPDKPTHISWIRRLMGDVPCDTLMYDPECDPDGSHYRAVRTLFPEARIWCWHEVQNSSAGIPQLDESVAVGDDLEIWKKVEWSMKANNRQRYATSP